MPSRGQVLCDTTLAGATAWLGRPSAAEAEPRPETTAVRISHSPSLCAAPQLMAEELLRAEGFTDVQYVKSADAGAAQWRDLATGAIHFGTAISGPLLVRLDAQDPIVLLAGIHVGCFEYRGPGCAPEEWWRSKELTACAAAGGP